MGDKQWRDDVDRNTQDTAVGKEMDIKVRRKNGKASVCETSSGIELHVHLHGLHHKGALVSVEVQC